MKSKLFAIILVVVFIFLAGCGKDEPSVPASNIDVPKQEAEVDKTTAEIDEFFKKYVNTMERPVAVMVDNDDKNARPHAGLDEAYLIYEMVVEGGATRFMALFRGENTEKIGPVRSSRHYFLDYVMENDAIYTHFGWSPKAITDISAFGIDKINGVLGTDESIFWREQKYKGDWHSAYTSIEKIRAMAEKKGYAPETENKNGLEYADKFLDLSDGKPANTVNLEYSGMYRTGYTYNQETKLYEKTINGQPHKLQNGKTLETKNIIIHFVYDTALGDGTARRNINTTGGGKGLYITGGSAVEISWSKPSRSGDTVYKKADGTKLLLNPGKTVINLISPSANVTVE